MVSRPRLWRRRLGISTAALLVLASAAAAQAGLNTWTTTGPEGGDMTVLAADPSTPGVVYSGGLGLFKTTTGARLWTPIPLAGVVSALAIDPVNPAIIYAGACCSGGPPSDSGLWKSTNGGATWARTGTGLPSFVRALAVDPKVPRTIYAGTGCCIGATGVFKSTDSGTTWTLSLSTETIDTIAINPQTPSTVYAATGGGGESGVGIFKTTDGGTSWNPVNTGLTRTNILALAIDPQTPSTLYAGANPGGVFKSINGGASWSPVNVGFNFVEALTVFTILIDPQTPTTVYVGTNGSGGLGAVFKSTNGGGSWSPSSSGLPVAFPASIVRGLALDASSPTTLYAATGGGGVFKTTDAGRQWTSTNTGLRASEIPGLFARPLVSDPRTPNVLYASTGGNGLFKSTNGGASWLSANSGLLAHNMTLAVDPVTPTTLYAGTPNTASSVTASVFKSTDGGLHWTPAGLVSVLVRDLAVDPQTPSTVYAGTSGVGALASSGGVFKTTNGGITWSALSAGPPDCVNAIAIDPKTPATVYAGAGCSSNDPTRQGVFKSTNGGVTWSPSHTGLPGDGVDFLAIDPQTPTTLYAATGGGLFKSVDGGGSWRSTSGVPEITALVIDPQTPSTLYAGTIGGGLFKSTNGGATWSAFSGAGLGNFDYVTVLVTNSTGSCLHAGTSTGVFSFATRVDAGCLPPPPLVAALSTTSQSGAVGTAARTIATVANVSGTSSLTALDAGSDGVAGVACGITQLTGAPTPFTFQAVDPADQPVAPLNTPIDIAPASSQRFRITLTPSAAVCPTDIQFGFNCSNTGLADILTGRNTLLLSAGPTSGCGLSASVTTSQASFVPGQTLVAGGSVTNSGLPGIAADFYAGVRRPDGSIQFVTPTGLAVGNLADLRSFRPLATNVPLTAPFTVSQSSLFTHQWTAVDLRGSYVFFVLTVKAGALTGGVVTNDQILKLATAPYSFP